MVFVYLLFTFSTYNLVRLFSNVEIFFLLLRMTVKKWQMGMLVLRMMLILFRSPRWKSGLIVTPPSEHVPPTKKKHVLRSVKRRLACPFEEVVDEAPGRKSGRSLADASEEVVDEALARKLKFVVLEDDWSIWVLWYCIVYVVGISNK